MIVRAQRGLRSNHSPSSTMRRITSYMSYGLARRVGQDVEQVLLGAVDRVGRLALRRRLARSLARKKDR